MSNDRIFMAKLRKLFYEHPEGHEFVFDENGVGILYGKSLKTGEWGKFICKDIEEPDDWKWGESLLRDEVLDTPAVVKMLVENDVLRTLLDEQFRSKNWLTAAAIAQDSDWVNNAEFLAKLRRVFITNPSVKVIAFDSGGRASGFMDVPLREDGYWLRTPTNGIPLFEITMPSWFDWVMPLQRADVLNDAGKAQMIAEHAQAFQKMFHNPNLKFATIDAEGVVEGHIAQPALTPNCTWASSAKFQLATTAVSFGWQYYWMVSRSEVSNATTSSKGQIWAVLNKQFVYIRCVDGSLFAFDEAMKNPYPLYGLDLPELAGLDKGEIIWRPGNAVWFAHAARILQRLTAKYRWVTGGKGYIRIHTQEPIYSPQKGWVSKGYDTFEMDVPLDGLSERLAIYGRSTKEVDYV